MYVWIAARFYFLLSFVDAYSRYVVHHKLLLSLDGASVATELEAALEAAGDVKPRVVHDHGSEFVNRDVAAVVKVHNLIEIKTRPRHPESNGIVERFNGTVRPPAATLNSPIRGRVKFPQLTAAGRCVFTRSERALQLERRPPSGASSCPRTSAD